MNLYLIRKPNPDGTPGNLIINDKLYCHTLEDRVRVDCKIPGDTAIWAGRYRVVCVFSFHFNRVLPHILGVEGFEGILIHGGNNTADTAGCILVAYNIVDMNQIYGSAADNLTALLASKKEDHWIEIFNGYPYRYDF